MVFSSTHLAPTRSESSSSGASSCTGAQEHDRMIISHRFEKQVKRIGTMGPMCCTCSHMVPVASTTLSMRSLSHSTVLFSVA